MRTINFISEGDAWIGIDSYGDRVAMVVKASSLGKIILTGVSSDIQKGVEDAIKWMDKSPLTAVIGNRKEIEDEDGIIRYIRRMTCPMCEETNRELYSCKFDGAMALFCSQCTVRYGEHYES